MLSVYFDATRVWLGKIVRSTLMSILQDTALDLDMSVQATSKKGLASKFGALLALRSSKQPKASSARVDEAKFIKLKVRVKGIVDAIVKAIDKTDIPAGILDFWRRLTSSGLECTFEQHELFDLSFFLCDRTTRLRDAMVSPSFASLQYKLFPTERAALKFDELGATRTMPEASSQEERSPPVEQSADTPGIQALDDSFSGFNVVIINFLVVRILIPHIVLQPWQVGIGSPDSLRKTTMTNLRNVATVLYQICRQLSSLPPIASTAPSATSASVAAGYQDSPTVPDTLTADHGATSATNATDGAGQSFLSIQKIGELLISDANFPVDEPVLKQFAHEQQVRSS
ncbi:hypothetical protein PybrP1_011713 [[Pythium] brassicae (nom. inval.)]|nr:hypothetical protein PybrP1_011713 [[Pythium] brassicae (nom. inval.)]